MTRFIRTRGWFHFRVRHPDPLGMARQYLLRFELAMDNPYAFTNGLVQLNNWYVTGYVWDWESHAGRHPFTPVYRIKYATGTVGPWRHFPEAAVRPNTNYLHTDGRTYRCLFEEVFPASIAWREVEVAQNLPYTLEDRNHYLNQIRVDYSDRYDDVCIRKRLCGQCHPPRPHFPGKRWRCAGCRPGP